MIAKTRTPRLAARCLARWLPRIPASCANIARSPRAAPAGLAIDLRSVAGFRPSSRSSTNRAPTFAENAAGKALHYSRFAAAARPRRRFRPRRRRARRRARRALGALRRPARLRRRARRQTARANARAGRRAIAARASSASSRWPSRGACPRRIFRRRRRRNSRSAARRRRLRLRSGFLFPPLDKTFAEITARRKKSLQPSRQAFRKLLEFLASSPVL